MKKHDFGTERQAPSLGYSPQASGDRSRLPTIRHWFKQKWDGAKTFFNQFFARRPAENTVMLEGATTDADPLDELSDLADLVREAKKKAEGETGSAQRQHFNECIDKLKSMEQCGGLAEGFQDSCGLMLQWKKVAAPRPCDDRFSNVEHAAACELKDDLPAVEIEVRKGGSMSEGWELRCRTHSRYSFKTCFDFKPLQRELLEHVDESLSDPASYRYVRVK